MRTRKGQGRPHRSSIRFIPIMFSRFDRLDGGAINCLTRAWSSTSLIRRRFSSPLRKTPALAGAGAFVTKRTGNWPIRTLGEWCRDARRGRYGGQAPIRGLPPRTWRPPRDRRFGTAYPRKGSGHCSRI